MDREQALKTLKEYNQEPFHLRHALTVEGVMRWFAEDQGFGDEADFWAMVGLLQSLGHRVVHVPHGLAALAAIATEPFDAALLDLDLPGLDGLALARMLRAQGRSLPLLAVTARSDAVAEAQARAAGFDDFLRKPVTGAMLAQALEVLQHPR